MSTAAVPGKILVHIYKPGKFGFADFIRAIAPLKMLAESKEFHYKIAINHPMAAYFLCDTSPYEITHNVHNETDYKNLDKALDSLQFLVVESNYNDFVTPVPRGLIEQYIIPTTAFIETASSKLSDLKLRSGRYTVFHVRCGDDDFFGKISVDEYTKLRRRILDRIGLIKRANPVPILMISSAPEALKSFKGLPGLVFTEFDTCHIGKMESDCNALRNTLIEFYLMRSASKIYGISGSTFGTGISGFSYWAAKMFGVPYTHFD